MKMNSADFDPESDAVFARIAGKYDRMCDVFSLYAHRLWKKRMVDAVCEYRGARVLDVASGTGDIALRLAKRNDGRFGEIIASDLCPHMLQVSKQKAARAKADLQHIELDAYDLADIADNSVDVYCISFAMKICARDQVLGEAMRVLRPGGIFLCLEASEIPLRWVHRAYLKYMGIVLPLIARITTDGDPSNYNYLLRGIHNMPNQHAFAAELAAHGLADVDYRNLSLGIVALHRARKPAV